MQYFAKYVGGRQVLMASNGSGKTFSRYGDNPVKNILLYKDELSPHLHELDNDATANAVVSGWSPTHTAAILSARRGMNMRTTLCSRSRNGTSNVVILAAVVAVLGPGKLPGQQSALRESHAQDIVIRAKQVIDADWMRSLAVSPSGRQVALVQTKVINGGGIRVRDLATGKLVRDYPIDSDVWQVAWSSDGRRLYFLPSSSAGRCGVLELSTAKVILLPGGCVERGQSGSLHRIAWLDDSTVVGYLGSAGTECNLASLTCGQLSARNLSRLNPRPDWLHATISANRNGPIALFSTSKGESGWRSLDLRGQVLDFDWLPSLDAAVVALTHSSSRHEVVLVRFGVSPGGPRYLGFAVPWTNDNTATATFSKVAQDTTFSFTAAVFDAQTNPLNGRVTGPVTASRKAELRFAGRCDQTLWWGVAGLHAPVSAGNVVGEFATNLDGYRWEGWLALDKTHLSDTLPACARSRVGAASRGPSQRRMPPGAYVLSTMRELSDTAQMAEYFYSERGVVNRADTTVAAAIREHLAQEGWVLTTDDATRGTIVAELRTGNAREWRRRTYFFVVRDGSYSGVTQTWVNVKLVDLIGRGGTQEASRRETMRGMNAARGEMKALLSKLGAEPR